MLAGGQGRDANPCPDVRPSPRSPRHREVLPRRNNDLAPVHSAHHDSSRAGMQDHGPGKCGHCANQRYLLSAIALAALASIAVLSGCSRPSVAPSPDPEAAVRKIRTDIRRGDLTVAQGHAEQELKRYSGRDPKWAIEFRLLDAEILGLEGRSQEVLALLSDNSASYPAVGDIAIKRKMFCGLAHAHVGQPQLADQELREAQLLAGSSQSKLEGEVLQTVGIVKERRDQRAEAATAFRASLDIAKQQNDKLLEAS